MSHVPGWFSRAISPASSRRRGAGLLAVALLCAASSTASAQLLSKTLSGTVNTLQQTTNTLVQTTAEVTQTAGALLPLSISASGNHAEIRIGNSVVPLADVSLGFQDATGLTPTSLGATAQIVNPATLLERLPELNLTQITAALPVLLTIEPSANGGLSFRGTGRLEIHTHLLPYSVGSSLRVFKAPLLGPFRDVTDEIAEGSVRARTTYGGFSQFLILIDLRPTAWVIEEKTDWLRGRIAVLPVDERGPLTVLLDQAESAVDAGNHAAAIAAVEAFRNRVQARAGQHIANEWQPLSGNDNHAGHLIAGANTLRFSIAYLRDFGQ